jgi:hypothetical protein
MQKVGPDLPRLPSFCACTQQSRPRFVPRNVHFWPFMRNNAAGSAFTHGTFLGQSVLELPVILVIEDDEQIQSLVEEALIEGWL